MCIAEGCREKNAALLFRCVRLAGVPLFLTDICLATVQILRKAGEMAGAVRTCRLQTDTVFDNASFLPEIVKCAGKRG